VKALVVDDHRINRFYLKDLISEHFPKIGVIDEAESVASAKIKLDGEQYDVIFLDIELTDGIGFDVLSEIPDFVYVIVVSNHREYAIDAFKHNVVDYLLKPVNLKDFKAAVKKVMDLYEKAIALKNPVINENSLKTKQEAEGSLLVNYKKQYVAIEKRDILYIKAIGKYSEIHVTGNKHYISYKNLKEFENAMPELLARIHHSYLVNVKSIVSFSRETSQVILSNGNGIPVSVRKREELFKKFNVF
jgi:two-component system LytT family response regulator